MSAPPSYASVAPVARRACVPRRRPAKPTCARRSRTVVNMSQRANGLRGWPRRRRRAALMLLPASDTMIGSDASSGCPIASSRSDRHAVRYRSRGSGTSSVAGFLPLPMNENDGLPVTRREATPSQALDLGLAKAQAKREPDEDGVATSNEVAYRIGALRINGRDQPQCLQARQGWRRHQGNRFVADEVAARVSRNEGTVDGHDVETPYADQKRIGRERGIDGQAAPPHLQVIRGGGQWVEAAVHKPHKPTAKDPREGLR
jgi:hypothetical protein